MNDQGSQTSVGGATETAKLTGAVVLVLGGIVAFYALHTQAEWIRWGSVIAGVVLGAVVFGASTSGRAFWQFVQESRLELRKVVWPTRQETFTTTAAVFVFVIVAGVFFWALDVFLSWATRLLTGQGG